MGVIPPPPPASDPTWKEAAEEEVTREEAPVSYVSSVSDLLLVEEPLTGEFVGPLDQQPSLMAVDELGNCVSVGVTSLTVTASLKDSSGNAVDGLVGNTSILFSTCWANFTDLSIQNSGENLTMVFTLKQWDAESRAFTVEDLPTTQAPSTTIIPTDAPETTPETPETTPDDSLFGSGATVTANSLCLVSVIYTVACCSDGIPIC
ncbi:hypothetical protein OYC64_003333 [Pagothenia borchgrevinki]|uniref:Uncharacterized protein n=1 Tax=Pagothenia borchgrevinki TaxID=8213 RepID=A0ABD2FPB9_PAGBO